jgi:hypothetical protein
LASILVLHALDIYSRETNIRHVKSFGENANGHTVTYVNVFGFSNLEQNSSFDLTILSYELLSYRNTYRWKNLVNRMKPYLYASGKIVIIPQDEFTNSDAIDEFAIKFNIATIFSPISTDLELVFPKAIKQGVQISQVLTGYARDLKITQLDVVNADFKIRKIDLGQRVRALPIQFGIDGERKALVASKFAEKARSDGFIVDVSSKQEDVLLGAEWSRFLKSLKFTISRRGGASIVDEKGKLSKRLNFIQKIAPSVSRLQLEKMVSRSGVRFGNFSSISPRLFEAAENGVCQILENDLYLEGMEPWVHYLPLNPDFSNLNRVFMVMRDLDACSQIVRNSQDLLITSGRYSYRSFVTRVLEQSGFALVYESKPTVIDLDSGGNFTTFGNNELLSVQSFWIQSGFEGMSIRGRQIKNLVEAKKKFALFANRDPSHKEILLLESSLQQYLNNEIFPESFTRHWRPAFL